MTNQRTDDTSQYLDQSQTKRQPIQGGRRDRPKAEPETRRQELFRKFHVQERYADRIIWWKERMGTIGNAPLKKNPAPKLAAAKAAKTRAEKKAKAETAEIAKAKHQLRKRMAAAGITD